MDSDERHHSESEFNYPDEADKGSLKDEILPSFTRTDVQNLWRGILDKNVIGSYRIALYSVML